MDKILKRNINDVKRGIRNLRKMGLEIEIHETESMFGAIVDNVYVIDHIRDRVCYQKHLFTVNPSTGEEA